MPDYRLTQRYGNFVITDPAYDTLLVVGPHDFDRQWAAWYVDVLNRDEVAPWPTQGLRSHAAFDSEHPSRLFTWNGLPVGTIGWNGLEWWWYTLDHWGNQFGEPQHIDVDPEQRARFVTERESVAKQPETVREVMQAELGGRIRMHRDETADMALMYGKVQARRRGKLYDEQSIDHTCTGYVDTDGTISHDGDTCPVHEA